MRCVAGVLLLIAVVFSQACARMTAVAEQPPAIAEQRQPVAAVQPQDQDMNCPELFAAIQVNALKISDFSGDQEGLKEFHKSKAGLFRGPHWFGTDWREAAEREIQALQIRHQYLMTLANKKECFRRKKKP